MSDRDPAVRERRDPTAATVNAAYTSVGAPMIPEWDAYQAFKSAYLAHVFVYRCVQVRARALAALPFRVGADPSKPNDYDRNAPLAQLLGPPPGGPNGTTTARKLWAWTVTQKIVSGRFGWELERDQRTGRPTALWPLPSSSLRAVPTDGGGRYFSGFQFGPPNKRRSLTTDQVLYAWNPSPTDWREPESVLQSARLDISVAIMQNRYDYAFLKNDARPAAVVVTEQFADDREYDRFKNQFMSEHRGVDNAGKVAFLETQGDENGSVLGAIDIKQLGLSHTDGAFIAREESKIRAICVALGVPLSKLGDASKRTFNNSGQEHQNFELDTVTVDAHDLEDEINLMLAPLMGDGLVGWFDLSSLTSSQVSRFAPVGLIEAYKAGIVDLDEARSELGLQSEDQMDADDPDGPETPAEEAVEAPITLVERATAFKALCDAGLTPTSAALLAGLDVTAIETKPLPTPTVPLVPAQGAAEAPRDGISSGSFPPGLPPMLNKHKPTGDSAGHCTTCGLPMDHSSHSTRDAAPDDRAAVGEARRTAAWRDMDARATALEHTFTRQMQTIFDRQAASTISRLEGKRGRQLLRDLTSEGRAPTDPAPDPGDIFGTDYWTADTEERLTPLYESTTAQGAQAIVSRFGGSFSLNTDLVQAFVKARANKLAGQVTDTTYEAIRQALADGVAAGGSIDDLVAAVRHVFDVATRARAETIARTEVLSAYNGAQDLQAAQLPEDVVAGKEWIATRDARTREPHADAEGQTVAMTDPFSIDDEDLQYPGDPGGSPENIINCRCTVGYLTPAEMPGAPGRAPTHETRSVEQGIAAPFFRAVMAGLMQPEALYDTASA